MCNLCRFGTRPASPPGPEVGSARLSGSYGGFALGGTGFIIQWTRYLEVKGQEPKARPLPQHLTVMPKDHTQWADLWGLHRIWVWLSNKAVYGLTVYLCNAFGTEFTAHYSKTMTHGIFNKEKFNHVAAKCEVIPLDVRGASSNIRHDWSKHKYSLAFNLWSSYSEELIIWARQNQQILSRLLEERHHSACWPPR